MGRTTYREFHNDLIALGDIMRADLISAAMDVMGRDWHASRKELVLQQDLPNSSFNAPKPRF